MFDRAALVAQPSLMRQRYIRHLSAILPEHVKILLITFEYYPYGMAGPPFTVSENEVQQLFSNRFRINILNSYDVLARYPAFQAAGLDQLSEHVYLLAAR